MPRTSLFDLAVNRALSYAQSTGISLNDANLKQKLEPWYLSTRFAYRIPLTVIVEVLSSFPEAGYFWQGGQAGGWKLGKNPHP